MHAQARRGQVLERLRRAGAPVSASALAEALGVSRQIIVGDVALLRAGGVDILATPKGYLLPDGDRQGERFAVACRHSAEEMGQELSLMVDCGCTVETVIVEHPVYGQRVGQLMLSNRYDVDDFIQKVMKNGAKPLSGLTGGIHLHTLHDPDGRGRERVLRALAQAGFLVE